MFSNSRRQQPQQQVQRASRGQVVQPGKETVTTLLVSVLLPPLLVLASKQLGQVAAKQLQAGTAGSCHRVRPYPCSSSSRPQKMGSSSSRTQTRVLLLVRRNQRQLVSHRMTRTGCLRAWRWRSFRAAHVVGCALCERGCLLSRHASALFLLIVASVECVIQLSLLFCLEMFERMRWCW